MTDQKLKGYAAELASKLSGNPISSLGDYDEVVDSISDVVEAAIVIDKALSDGFQWTDLIAALSLEPVVKELIKDFPVFWEQFLALRPSEALTVVSEIEERISKQGPLGRVTKFVLDILFNIASTFGFVEMAIVKGTEVFKLWKGLRLEPKN